MKKATKVLTKWKTYLLNMPTNSQKIPLRKDNSVLKPFQLATWTTTGLLTTLVANAALAAGLGSFIPTAGTEPAAPWRFVPLPERYAKPPSLFDVVAIDGKKVLRVQTDKSWGSLVHAWAGEASTLRFQWRLDKPLAQSSLQIKATEDAALKACVSFDMPASQIPAGERTLFKLAQFFTRDKLPTATLCYVWAQSDSVGSLIPSPVTARVRYMVLNDAATPLRTWQEHQRNLKADFLTAFKTEATAVPAITAIVVGADADNTAGSSLGYISDIVVLP